MIKLSSIYNPIEAEALMDDFSKAYKKFEKLTFGIISPYKRQVQYLKEQLQKRKLDKIEIGTVDSFQGREKDVIYFSSVRANSDGQIGLLNRFQFLQLNAQIITVSLKVSFK